MPYYVERQSVDWNLESKVAVIFFFFRFFLLGVEEFLVFGVFISISYEGVTVCEKEKEKCMKLRNRGRRMGC